MSKIIHAGGAETDQQVDPGDVEHIHQRPSGAIPQQLAVLVNEQAFRGQQAKDRRGRSQRRVGGEQE